MIEQLCNDLATKVYTTYEHGHQAGLSGKSYFDCPYSNIDHMYDYRQWMKGHSDGIRDRMLKNPLGDWQL